MKNFNINKFNLLNITFLIFAVFPLLPNNLKGFSVFFLVIGSILNYKPHKVNYKWFFINSSLYLLFLASLVYSSNIDYGLKKIETTLSLLVIPICFFLLIPNKKIENGVKQKFMKVFISSTTVFSIITLFFILTDSKTEYYKNFYSNKFRVIVENVPLIGQHPIYASLFLGIALIFTLFIITQKNSFSNRFTTILIMFSVVINTILIIMLSSRAVILSLFVLMLIYMLKLLVKSKKRKRIIGIFILMIVSTILLFTFNRRMNEMMLFDTYKEVNTNFSNSYRVNIYKCALQVIKKSVWIGHGVGDEKDQLNICYEKEDQLLLKKGYNSHNQYLDILIKLGIVGLICFVLFLFYNLYKAFFSFNSVLFYLILFYCINFLTENVLVRQSGLILFVFLIHFFRLDNQKIISDCETY